MYYLKFEFLDFFTVPMADRRNDPIRRSKFSSLDDKKLSDLVASYGTRDWVKIASFMTTKSSRQCRERYIHYLDPMIKNDPWTKENDDRLLELFPTIGTRWKQYMIYFPGKSTISIKNRWSSISRRKPKVNSVIIKPSCTIIEFFSKLIPQHIDLFYPLDETYISDFLLEPSTMSIERIPSE